MAAYVEGKKLATEVEPLGLLSEGAAGVAVIVLAIVALAGVSSHALAAIAAIVIGGGLMIQALNSAAEHSKAAAAETVGAVRKPALGGEAMVDCLCGFAGIVLGVLALVGSGGGHLLPAALIIFGGGLLVGGAASARSPTLFAAGGMEMLIGLSAIVLGILSVLMTGTAVLVLVGFLAVGAGLLLVSAALGDVMLELFATAT
jgi:hypothetical protein